jgi:hypothetical protein
MEGQQRVMTMRRKGKKRTDHSKSEAVHVQFFCVTDRVRLRVSPT